MEEDIKILEEMQNICRYKTYIENEEREEWFREYQAIENILNKLEELEKENKELKEAWCLDYKENLKMVLEQYVPKSFLEKDYIPKSRIENKIEELETVLDLMDSDNYIAEYKKQILKEEIDDLKELLEEI